MQDQRKQRRKPMRLRGFDYSTPGYYFVTICIEGRVPILSRIVGAQIKLSTVGELVQQHWHRIPVHFAEVRIDSFVVMPNHIHGILVLPDTLSHKTSHNRNTARRGAVSARESKFGWPLGTVIAYFKYNSTKVINVLQGTPGGKLWQRGYHDHIIRNEQDLNVIRHYIRTNPLRWALDRYYCESG